MYKIAEKFKSLQGEGVYAGCPMAFLRFVGCSVGKKICQHCDTDFDTSLPWRGGGDFSASALYKWAYPFEHICLTGGEPLDQDLEELFQMISPDVMLHIETSGTKPLSDLLRLAQLTRLDRRRLWICVSPKPGFLENAIDAADEVKVIVPGLGNGTGWPQLTDALRWARMGKTTFLQPRNSKFDVDKQNLLYVTDLLQEHTQLRLSLQLHKLLKVQ